MANEKIGGIEMEASLDTAKLDQGVKKVDESLKKLDPSLNRTEKNLKDVEQAGKGAGDGVGKLGLSFGKLFPAMTAANLAADAIRRTLRGVKDAFLDAVRGAISFEKSLVQVRKVTGATRKEMGDLKKFVQDLAVQTGIERGELTDIAAGGARLGIFDREGPEGLKEFTETIAKSRIAMEDYAGSSEDASDKTARLLNLFNLGSSDAEELLSIINELSNTAAATSSNIADNVTNFASLSQTFDASKESLLALATTMEEVGSEPQAFSTALQTALIRMQADTEKFATFLGPTLGEQFKETFKTEPVEAFMLFLQGLGKTGRDVGKTLDELGIGDARLIRELAKLSTDRGLELFAKNLDTAEHSAKAAQNAVKGLTGEASSLEDEFRRASDTTGRRIDSLGESAGNAGTAFGDELLPVINVLADTMAGWLTQSIGLMATLGEMIANATTLSMALTAEFGGAVSRTVKFVSGAVRKPGELLGIAEKGAADRLVFEAIHGRSPEQVAAGEGTGSPGADILLQLKRKKEEVEKARARSAGSSFAGSSDALGDLPMSEKGAKAVAAAEKKILDIEKKILDALGDQAKAGKEMMKTRREELVLRQRLGLLTEKEGRELANINRRVAFQEDGIKDATKAWEEQVDALEDVEDKIKDINEKIVDERKKLNETLADIDKSAADSKLDLATKLVKELREIENELVTGNADDVKKMNELRSRRAEIDRLLDPFRLTAEGRSMLGEADKNAGMNEFQLLDMETAKKKEAARAESDARIEGLTEELNQAETNKSKIVSLEEEKKNAVLNALQQRADSTAISYAKTVADTEAFIQTQTEQFNRLANAMRKPAVPIRRAAGGPIYGPGGGTDDKIHAMLSNGEHVLTAAEVNAAGGHGAIYQFREALRAGIRVNLPRFANGGAVSHANNSRNVTQNIHYHGNAARAMSSPSMIAWSVRANIR